MSKPYKLKSVIDESANADGNDVQAVKAALDDLGYYNRPEWGITPYADREMFEAIERFQADHGLKRDRVVKPGGETEKELAARSPMFRCVACGAPHGGAFGKLCKDCFDKASKS